jgi:hypothetical protein
MTLGRDGVRGAVDDETAVYLGDGCTMLSLELVER